LAVVGLQNDKDDQCNSWIILPASPASNIFIQAMPHVDAPSKTTFAASEPIVGHYSKTYVSELVLLLDSG
jgi:hypothetical protein